MKKVYAQFCLRLFCIFSFVLTAKAETFSEAQLEDLIQKKSVQSITDLVPLLPVEFRKNFTFVYKSRSPFKDSISPLFPRVVLFSADARQVLTFTGEPNKPGYDYLEMMTFSDKTSDFHFSIYELPNALKSGKVLTAQEKNCNRCHGEDPRPINDSYPLWPGFYGSIQDTFPAQSKVGRAEHENYLQFLKTNAHSGVYKDLIYPKGSPVSPYLDPKNFSVEKREGNLNDFRFLPNTRLGMALTELNRKRIYRKLSQSVIFKKRQKEFLAELLGCSKSKRPSSGLTKIEKALSHENQERLIRLGSDPLDASERINDMQELKFAKELEQIDWVAETSQVSREDWSMALEPNSLSFFDGILSGIWNGQSYYIKEDLIFEMIRNLSEESPKRMNKYFQIENVYSWLGFPFGNRINISRARQVCSEL